MPLECRPLRLSKDATGVVVRPRTGLHNNGSEDGSPPPLPSPQSQILIFLGDEIRELLPSCALNSGQPPFRLGPPLRLHGNGHAPRNAGLPIFEPTSRCIFYVEGSSKIMRLDCRDVVHLAAGGDPSHRGGWRAMRHRCSCSPLGLPTCRRRRRRRRPHESCDNDDDDGFGAAARLTQVCALAADGRGSVYVAEAHRIRRLEVASGEVTTLPGSAPPALHWTALSYNAAADVLVAATPYMICHIAVPCEDGAADAGTADAGDKAGGGGDGAIGPRLVAGSWGAYGRDDGAGTAARFYNINVVLASACRSLYIADATLLRIMDCHGYVRTILSGCLPYCCRFMTALPTGDLALSGFTYTDPWVMFVCGGGFAPSSPALGGWPQGDAAPASSSPAAELFRLLSVPLPPGSPLRSSAARGGGGAALGGGNGASGAAASGRGGTSDQTLTVVVGGNHKAFVAHRSVLAAWSDHFRKLLAPGGCGGGGGASAAAAPASPDAASAAAADAPDAAAASAAASGLASLPKADPDAFGWLLAYMYTGELAVPDELLHPAVELAARLGLPAACITKLQARLLAAVTPGSVVSELVWAEQHGMADLMEQLEAYLERHRREVVSELDPDEAAAAAAAAAGGGASETTWSEAAGRASRRGSVGQGGGGGGIGFRRRLTALRGWCGC
ncbi:Ankyrin repeat and BTB/POZ domain-containing protein 1 [Pleodorina starrii]|uniref:Ankyrin repeat and BTB/POZ domain-containing protein 1 n=1 Tax=Pleodorina starrii TaxID=330485 RepID=A0A9W6F9T1_9CHLO|nr:Ankyrin repeat and BTB/POZ domain-containing protein 1 [Pleodorina starrii]